MSMTGHPDFEGLSAYHDGDAPELAAHVATCAECGALVAELAVLSAAVAERPVATPSARERAITTALAGASGYTGPGRGHGRRWVAAMSVAASLVAVLATVALVRGGQLGGGERDANRAATESAPASGPDAAGGGAGRAGPGDADSAVLGGDLGEVADAAVLAAKVAPSRRAIAEADTGGASTGASSDSAQALTTPPSDAARVVGTRPCEIEARDPSERGAQGPSGGGLGPVVYLASATRGGVPLVVLGFARADDTGVTLYAMERDGCRLLFSSPL